MATPSTKKTAQASESGKLIKVLGGHFAPLSLYRSIERLASGRMERIVDGKLYTLKEIIGNERWEALPNNWAKRMAGRCFAHMVSIGRFPFKFVQYKRYCTKRYQLKQ